MNLHGTCETCRHSVPSVDQPGIFDCRRFPPQVSIIMVPARHELSGQTTLAPQVHTMFPQLGADFYCGEWGKDLSNLANQ